MRSDEALKLIQKALSYRDQQRETKANTTSWRVSGLDFDGDCLDVGVDLVQDHLGGFVVVMTVF